MSPLASARRRPRAASCGTRPTPARCCAASPASGPCSTPPSRSRPGAGPPQRRCALRRPSACFRTQQ
eukprot:3576558-Rhodomonas_salina.1